MRRLAALAALAVLVAPAASVAAEPMGLSGELTGIVADHAGPPDSPTTRELTGSGTTNLGPTSLHGEVRGTGFVQYGTCSGRLVLTSTRGSLTLGVSSARINGFTACPQQLSWRITSATGSLRGRSGHGTMRLVAKSGHFRLTFDGPGTTFPTLPTTGAPEGMALIAVLLLLLAGSLRRPVREA